MLYQINQAQWISLSAETRKELKKIFDIPKSEGAIGTPTGMISDGHSNKDLAFITVDKMNKYLSANYEEKEYFIAFEKVLEKINGKDTRANKEGNGIQSNSGEESKGDGNKEIGNGKDIKGKTNSVSKRKYKKSA